MKIDEPLTLKQQQMVADNFSWIKHFCYLHQLDYEEFSSDLSLVLIKAVKTYPDNATFKIETHIMRNFNYYIHNIYRKHKQDTDRMNNTISIDDLVEQSNEPYMLDDYSTVLVLAELKDKLTDKEFNLFYLWYFKKMTYSEIGKIYQVSHQRIGTQMKKIFTKIHQIFKNSA